MDIKQLYKENNIPFTDNLNKDILTKKDFPKEFLWLYELLLIIPIAEQTARESFIRSLPDNVIAELTKKIKKQENELISWYAEEPSTEAKYYAGLITDLIEELYIGLSSDEKFFKDLEYYKNEVLAIITTNKILKKRYEENKAKINISSVFDFIAPLLLLINEKETAKTWSKKMPSELLDLNAKIIERSTDYIDLLLEKNSDSLMDKDDIVKRIIILTEASSLFWSSFFE